MLPWPEIKPPTHLRELRLADDLRLAIAVCHQAETSGADLAQALIHDLDVLVFTEQLQGILSGVLGRIARDCTLYGVPLPRERAREELHRLARAYVADKASGALSFTQSPRGYPALTPRVQTTCAAREVQLKFTRGSNRQFLKFQDEQLPEVSRILSALAHGEAKEEFGALSFTNKNLVRLLHALGALVPAEPGPLPEPLESKMALRITHLAHAGALIEAGSARVVIDPWLGERRAEYETQPFSARELGRLDAVLITHHHGDHMVEQALLTLPRDVLMLVPHADSAPLSPDYLATFTRLGFTNVRAVSPGEAITLAGEVVVDVLPFWGEARDRLGFGANLYAVSHAGRSVFFHADAAPDAAGRSTLHDPLFTAFLDKRGQVDVIFGTWWQERRFGLDISALALVSDRLDLDSWLDRCETCDVPFEYNVELARRTKARLFLSYAEQGDALFAPYDAGESYIPAVSFLWRPWSELKQALEAHTGAHLRRALPRMVVNVPREGEPRIDDSRAPRSHLQAPE